MRTEDKVIAAIEDYADAEAYVRRCRDVIVAARERVQKARKELARQLKNFAGRGVPVWYDGQRYRAIELSDCELDLEILECDMRIIHPRRSQSESQVDVTANTDHPTGD